jgi:hypothetical protein
VALKSDGYCNLWVWDPMELSGRAKYIFYVTYCVWKQQPYQDSETITATENRLCPQIRFCFRLTNV